MERCWTLRRTRQAAQRSDSHRRFFRLVPFQPTQPSKTGQECRSHVPTPKREGRRATDTTRREDWSTFTINLVKPTQLTFFRSLSECHTVDTSGVSSRKGQQEEWDVEHRPVQSWLLFGTPVYVPLFRAFPLSTNRSVAKKGSNRAQHLWQKKPQGSKTYLSRASWSPSSTWVWSRTLQSARTMKLDTAFGSQSLVISFTVEYLDGFDKEYHDNGW